MNFDKKILERAARIKHVALDMDGTIYKGGTLFPFTIPFLDKLKRMGIGYSFLTNNPSRSCDDYLNHLSQMGIKAAPEELYTTALATIDYIKTHFPAYRRLFILGTPSMIGEFERAGFVSVGENACDVPDAVVVAFDSTLVYKRMCRAAWWIEQGKTYIATNPDRICPTDEPTVLVDCGSICAALEYATGRKPDIVMGKPDPNMLTGILNRHRLEPSQVAMVGDRVYTDLLMAHRAHTLGVLVLSGETARETGERADPRPDVILENLESLGRLLEEARHN